jgi:hypothetical protein
MNQPRLIFCSLILLLAACQRDQVVYTIGAPGGPPVSSIIAVKSLSSLQVEADSATTCVIAIQINPNTDSVSRPVVFSTTNGTFSNRLMTDTVTPDAYGVATASFVSNTTGPAKVSADLQSFIVDTLIDFTPALPDNMLMTSSAYTGTVMDTFVLSCQLSRNIGRGKVSDPVKILFQQSAATAAQGLIFSPFANTANGRASIVVYNPYHVTGTFNVTVSTVADNTTMLTNSVTLIIK